MNETRNCLATHLVYFESTRQGQIHKEAFHNVRPKSLAEKMSRTDKDSAESEKTQVEVSNSPSPEEIRQRAYELYMEGGCVHGRDLDDWLQAERDLMKK
jgi:DUF2934 family protein